MQPGNDQSTSATSVLIQTDFYMQTVQQKFNAKGREVHISKMNVTFEGSDHSISLDVPEPDGITTDKLQILPLCHPRVRMYVPLHSC